MTIYRQPSVHEVKQYCVEYLDIETILETLEIGMEELLDILEEQLEDNLSKFEDIMTGDDDADR